MNKETIAIHHGYEKDSQGTTTVPIYQTTAYAFSSAKNASDRFSLQDLGNIYTRLTNPTTAVLEARLAEIEGGVSAIATSSGQASIFYAISNLAEAGDNIILSDKVYGGSVTLLKHTMKRFGIEAKVFNLDDPSTIEALVDDKTKAIFYESLSNPQIAVADIDAISAIAKKHGIISICDNTVATSLLVNPIAHGTDIVVHSCSKYISGQGIALGGVIIDRDGLTEFFKGNPRYPHFNEPDESYQGLVYTDLPFPPFNLRMRLALLRDIGASPSPFNSWSLIQSLETLSLRIEKHSSNALKVAKFLESHPKVFNLNYPGLESNSYNTLAKKYFKDGQCSGLISFEVEDKDSAWKVLDNTNLFSIVVNIGDSKSIITHPSSTTHQQIPLVEQKKIGITEGLIRLSVGLENADDLIADLKAALDS
ncbi:O-acetylhomoserine aminocarboxypropyltransferase/cysteine synthase family protein [Sulfurimonas sp.]|uniref:O-acetylhomoserine aminocarboxypropyltransferase/cysteine synthase family protein n=1 Tax=Sulfurimonas sp. TaxID=2022749 RepID=UPI0025FE072B|nr:O-acetylhomoserine aminocarboxypropyltransferase/cysteine synthase family protein [Sulfurimonas sp.]